MNFNSSYNYICYQQSIQTDMGQENTSIKSTVNQLKMNYQAMSPKLINNDMNMLLEICPRANWI
jgi:hypothetical protein